MSDDNVSERETVIGSDEWWERQLAEDRRYYFFRDLERRFGIDFQSEPERES